MVHEGFFLRIQSLQKSVNQFTCGEELQYSPYVLLCILGLWQVINHGFVWNKVRPGSGNQRTAAVRKNQAQNNLSSTLHVVENIQGLSLHWMVLAKDGYFRGESLEVGSVSRLPLIRYRMTSC